MRDLLKKIRKLEIKIKKRVDSGFSGEYHSLFRGQGLIFEEVRRYQFGDDIRFIDWNVTAKTGELYVKVFREEREQNIFVLFDVSGSQDFGKKDENKLQIGTEIAAILAYSAFRNNDHFGLLTFSDQVEQYHRPAKGRKHLLAIISNLLQHQPKNRQTNIANAVEYFQKVQKKRSVVFIVSDFLDENYMEKIKRLRKKHQVFLIRLYHPDEVFRETLGIVPVIDAETNELAWINSSATVFRRQIESKFQEINEKLDNFSKKQKFFYLEIDTSEDYFKKLETFFHKQNSRHAHR